MGLGCAKASSRKVVAVIPKGQAHIFWQTVHAGAAAAGKEFNLTIEWNGPAAENDFSKQVEIVENFINRRVDGIVLAPTTQKGLVNVIEKAKKEGIPVTIFDSGAETEDYVSFVATDNYAGGVMAAKRLGQILHGKGNVAIVATMPGGASTMERERGFEETLAKEFPEMKVVAKQFGMSDYAKSLAVSEDILTANQNLNGMFASNESSAVGAMQAIKARGLGGKLPFVGFDSSQPLLDALKNGIVDSLVLQDPYKMGYESVKSLADLWAGHTPPKRIDSGARLVTKEDLGKPEFQRLLNPPLVF
jgi:ribose transport system substrate-binding protein